MPHPSVWCSHYSIIITVSSLLLIHPQHFQSPMEDCYTFFEFVCNLHVYLCMCTGIRQWFVWECRQQPAAPVTFVLMHQANKFLACCKNVKYISLKARSVPSSRWLLAFPRKRCSRLQLSLSKRSWQGASIISTLAHSYHLMPVVCGVMCTSGCICIYLYQSFNKLLWLTCFVYVEIFT